MPLFYMYLYCFVENILNMVMLTDLKKGTCLFRIRTDCWDKTEPKLFTEN